MKKVSLRELVADKIVYAVLLAMTYWLWARNDWKPGNGLDLVVASLR